MFTQLKRDKFANSRPLRALMQGFLNISEDFTDLALTPTLIGDVDPSCTEFCLRNPAIFKEALVCSYKFVLKVKDHLQPLYEVQQLSSQQEKA